MITTLTKKILLALALASVACTASAQWVLNNAESSIDFISIKNSNVAEIHTFGALRGALKKNGKATVKISLASVDTKIPVRDDRMKSTLFEADKFPESVVSAVVDFERISRMKAGESFSQPVQLNLSIHGEENLVEADMRIVMLAENRLMVSTVKPIVVNAGDFSLGKGVEMLREIAQLLAISTAVPVTANLVFER